MQRTKSQRMALALGVSYLASLALVLSPRDADALYERYAGATCIEATGVERTWNVGGWYQAQSDNQKVTCPFEARDDFKATAIQRVKIYGQAASAVPSRLCVRHYDGSGACGATTSWTDDTFISDLSAPSSASDVAYVYTVLDAGDTIDAIFVSDY